MFILYHITQINVKSINSLSDRSYFLSLLTQIAGIKDSGDRTLDRFYVPSSSDEGNGVEYALAQH